MEGVRERQVGVSRKANKIGRKGEKEMPLE